MDLSPLGRIGRKMLSRFLYANIYSVGAIQILLGKEKPLIRFTVEEDPPSVYYNFPVLPDQVDALTRYLDLPRGFSLAKLRYLESDKDPFYCLTLNVYRVSGITNGLRAEWSVYVNDLEGRVRYLVAEARASQHSMDPVDIITRKYPLKHEVQDGTINTYTTSSKGSTFRGSCPVPTETNAVLDSITKDWLAANDEIYWGNGVYDRAFYNRGMACTKIWSLPPETVIVEHSTDWSPFLAERPAQVVVLPQAVEFVCSPWWNL